MVPTRRRESRGDRARGEPANVEEYHPARERVNQGRVPSVPPRHDVEGEIYGRLYGAAGEHGDAPRRVLGRHDPALVAPVHEDRREPPPGRLQYAANAVRARARTWLATGAVSETAAQRRDGVVAPAPSVARARARGGGDRARGGRRTRGVHPRPRDRETARGRALALGASGRRAAACGTARRSRPARASAIPACSPRAAGAARAPRRARTYRRP